LQQLGLAVLCFLAVVVPVGHHSPATYTALLDFKKSPEMLDSESNQEGCSSAHAQVCQRKQLELGGLFFFRVQWGIWKVETGNWELAEK
jgi:hypothetical protein